MKGFTTISSHNRGFTLVEVLITVTIVSIAGLLLAQLLIQNNGLFYQQTTKVSHGLDLNSTKLILLNDLKSAHGVIPEYPLISPIYTSSTTTLILKVSATDSSGNILDGTFDYIVYSADSSNSKVLRKRYFPDPASSKPSQNQVLLTQLSFLQFIYLDQNGAIVSPASASRVNFTLNVNTQVGLTQQEASSSGDITLRNI